jgi:hypothetical protein
MPGGVAGGTSTRRLRRRHDTLLSLDAEQPCRCAEQTALLDAELVIEIGRILGLAE